MSAFWRQVGLNYVQFSRICGQAVRYSLKGDKAEIAKRAEAMIKVHPWKDGKPIKREG